MHVILGLHIALVILNASVSHYEEIISLLRNHNAALNIHCPPDVLMLVIMVLLRWKLAHFTEWGTWNTVALDSDGDDSLIFTNNLWQNLSVSVFRPRQSNTSNNNELINWAQSLQNSCKNLGKGTILPSQASIYLTMIDQFSVKKSSFVGTDVSPTSICPLGHRQSPDLRPLPTSVGHQNSDPRMVTWLKRCSS